MLNGKKLEGPKVKAKKYETSSTQPYIPEETSNHPLDGFNDLESIIKERRAQNIANFERPEKLVHKRSESPHSSDSNSSTKGVDGEHAVQPTPKKNLSRNLRLILNSNSPTNSLQSNPQEENFVGSIKHKTTPSSF